MLEFSCDTLSQMLVSNTVIAQDGNGKPLSSGLNEAFLNALYRTVLRHRPGTVLEVGMAYGTSSLAILSALSNLNSPRKLLSIDPNQSSDWNNIGVLNVKRAGFGHLHSIVEQPDYIALPELLKNSTTIDFAYIDGWHTFDSVLLDFFYIDKMLPVGGIVAFNDTGYRAIHRVLQFVRTHRKYEELTVGLRRDYSARNPLVSLARRVTDFSREDRYFQKQKQWEPTWDFYMRF